MPDRDLRDFLTRLEDAGELRRIRHAVSPHLEMTALSDRVLRGGPALLFENPTGHTMPVLTNLFGTPSRVARALGVAGLADIRAFGEVLAQLKEPEPPRGMKSCGAGATSSRPCGAWRPPWCASALPADRGGGR
jgi:4-hydroxy-3-polyprenylbenzoate decarboxylase